MNESAVEVLDQAVDEAVATVEAQPSVDEPVESVDTVEAQPSTGDAGEGQVTVATTDPNLLIVSLYCQGINPITTYMPVDVVNRIKKAMKSSSTGSVSITAAPGEEVLVNFKAIQVLRIMTRERAEAVQRIQAIQEAVEKQRAEEERRAAAAGLVLPS